MDDMHLLYARGLYDFLFLLCELLLVVGFFETVLIDVVFTFIGSGLACLG